MNESHERITDAETTGGGFPGWVGNIAGGLRTNNAAYTQGNCCTGSHPEFRGLTRILLAWTPYMTAIAKIISRNQITNGGPSRQSILLLILIHVDLDFLGG